VQRAASATWSSPFLRIAFAIAILSTLVRSLLALRWYGFQTGDDLEIAEAALRTGVGLVHQPWSIRNLLIPELLVAPFARTAWLLGFQDPLELIFATRLPFLLLGGINVLLVYFVGHRWFSEKAGAIAATLYAVHWIPLVYGSSSYPRTFAVTCILAAVLLIERGNLVSISLAGGLAALAVTTRYSEAIFLLSLLFLVRSWRAAAALVAGFGIGLFLFVGVYDRITWDAWFASAWAFARLTFQEQDASSLNVRQPVWWYVTSLPHWIPLAALPLVVATAIKGQRRRLLAFLVLPVFLLSLIFHKEMRYLQCVVPFVMLLAAAGYEAWPWRRWVAIALLGLAYPLALGRITGVTRRSNNAVDAARWMAEQRPGSIALSQAWAYGGRVVLGNEVVMHDIGIPPEPGKLAALPPEVTVVGVYASEADPERLALLQFRKARTFADRGGRAVTVFTRERTAIPAE
jgi:hypothetical protein